MLHLKERSIFSLLMSFNADFSVQHALGAFPIACRRQWRTPYPSAHNARGAPDGEHVSPKAEMRYWGHCGIGNVLPKIVKLPNIHQRLTRHKMRMDNLSSKICALEKKSASFEIRKSSFSRREVIHAHLLAREALMNVRKFDNLRKDIAYPAMSPILHLRFWGNMFSIWCSTCIVRTYLRHWRLQTIGKAPRLHAEHKVS